MAVTGTAVAWSTQKQYYSADTRITGDDNVMDSDDDVSVAGESTSMVYTNAEAVLRSLAISVPLSRLIARDAPNPGFGFGFSLNT